MLKQLFKKTHSQHPTFMNKKEEPAPDYPMFAGEPSYSGDFLKTWNKSVSFLDDERFVSAYQRGMNSGHSIGRKRGENTDIHIEWRIHTCLWAASHARNLPGDFVECGTNTGIMSLAICEYLDFNQVDKSFWLFDTFEGAPIAQFTREEISAGRDKTRSQYFSCYELAQSNFADFERAKLIKGEIPGSLDAVEIDEVAYLCVDMNLVTPEVAALDFFWPKLTTGGVVVLDDYGWRQCELQKRGHDDFAKRMGVEILLLPTGQGLILKP